MTLFIQKTRTPPPGKMNDSSILFRSSSALSRAKKKSSVKIKVKPNLKDCFNKSYTFQRCDNYSKFLRALGTKKCVRIQALESKPTIVLSQLTNSEYLLTTTYPEGKTVRVKFKIGQPFQRRRPCGVSDSIMELVDNKLIERQTVEGQEVVIVREFHSTELVVTMEVNGVKCYRFFLKSASKHSIGTETSRRNSLNLTNDSPEGEPEVVSVLAKEFNSQSESEEEICL